MTAIYGKVYMGNRFVPDDGVVVQRARQAVTLALKKKQILGQPMPGSIRIPERCTWNTVTVPAWTAVWLRVDVIASGENRRMLL